MKKIFTCILLLSFGSATLVSCGSSKKSGKGILGGTNIGGTVAKTVGTGNYGDAPAASGCAAGLTPTNERAITVCRVATRSPQLPPLIETQTNPRTSVYAYYNAAWSVLGTLELTVVIALW